MTATIKGWESWSSWVNKLDNKVAKSVADECMRTGLKVERGAKSIAPVDTARLRNSISTTGQGKGDKIKIIIGTDVEYAIYVEFGTIRTPKQPFLFNTFEKEIKGLDKRLKEIVNKELS